MNFLLLCLLFLGLGYLSGKRLKIPKNVSGQISWSLLLFMLLSLGYGIGANRQILENLNSLGIQALVICLTAILGSITAIWLYLIRRGSSDR